MSYGIWLAFPARPAWELCGQLNDELARIACRLQSKAKLWRLPAIFVNSIVSLAVLINLSRQTLQIEGKNAQRVNLLIHYKSRYVKKHFEVGGALWKFQGQLSTRSSAIATLSDTASRCLFFPAGLFKLCPSLYVYHGSLTCEVAVTERQHVFVMLYEEKRGNRREIPRESTRYSFEEVLLSCVWSDT